MNGQRAKELAFEQLSKIENVRILDYNKSNKLGFEPKYEVWEVCTEISIEGKYFPVVFHLYFTSHFPYKIPRIYLSPETFAKLKYIPHINSKRFVCTYDDDIRTNPDEPFGIVNECLNRARQILVDGITKINDLDFITEFKAYWEQKYEDENEPKDVLSLIDELHEDDILKLIRLNEPFSGYKYILHKSDILSEQLKELLKEYEIGFVEVCVFYLHVFPFYKPPFYYRNKDVLEILNIYNSNYIDGFKRFINGKDIPKLVISKKTINDRDYIFGWFHSRVNINMKGYRIGAVSPFLSLSTFQSNDIVERITTDTYTPSRLQRRTSGDINTHHYSFSVAGVGSVGSNLVHFLNSFNSPSFNFVDGDRLNLENIGRHFLGFRYVNGFKTIALKNYLQSSNLFQKILSREKSIIEVLLEDASFINICDYLFVCIGDANIDLWICQAMKDKLVRIPVFFIWVEPYLCAGHCLYLHPDNPEFEKYFIDGLFVNNIIPNKVYNDGRYDFTLREAGCQTSFIPYSSNNVMCFLSRLFSEICLIIDLKSTKTTSYTWIGDVAKLKELNIPTSAFVDRFEHDRLIENTL